jgi:hypothetical protein
MQALSLNDSTSALPDCAPSPPPSPFSAELPVWVWGLACGLIVVPAIVTGIAVFAMVRRQKRQKAAAAAAAAAMAEDGSEPKSEDQTNPLTKEEV